MSFNIVATYTKTGTGADNFIIGGWATKSTMGLFNTLPTNVPGVGVRMFIQNNPIANLTWHQIYPRILYAAGKNLTETYTIIIELVVTNASLYNGGIIEWDTTVEGLQIRYMVVVGNDKVWSDKSVATGGSRCGASMTIIPWGAKSDLQLPTPTVSTCDLGATAIVVGLEPVDSSSLQTVGNRTGGKAFSIPLGNCGKDAKPYITFTDSSNKANRTSTLSLSPGSTAAGVGIAIEKSDGSLVQFGAENASVSVSNVGQFLIGSSTVAGTSVPLNLTAQYVRTNEALKSGNIRADAIFTVAYP